MTAYENKPSTARNTGGKELTSSRIDPSVIATEEREKSTFSTIRQGTATNALTKVKASTKRNTVIDLNGTATITQGSLTITIPNFTELTGFKTSTYQLLDALTVALTEAGAGTPVVALSLEEYMEKRGLKDRKEARKQASDDLETLFNAKISFKEKRKRGQQEEDFHDIRIIDSKGIRNGIINVSFGTVFFGILSDYPIMPYPDQLFRLNGKRNPNSFYLLRKITEHKNMNSGKKNEDTIAVKTLLAVASGLPSKEEVMATGRQLTQRIIEPFERDMNALEDTLTWEYCHSLTAPLTEEEIEQIKTQGMTYEMFEGLLIKVTWKDYPDQTARLARKAQKAIEAEKKNRSRSSKKKSK